MSNVLLSKIGKVTRKGGSLAVFQNVPIRHIGGKKFIVPDSFQPHLRTNNNRRNVKRPERPGSRYAAPGQFPNTEVESSGEKDLLQVLDNRIENQAAQESQERFALANESAIYEFCGQTHHPHVTSSMKAYLSVHYPNKSAIPLFWDAVADYLPPDPLTRHGIQTACDKLKHNSYSWASQVRDQRDNATNYGINLTNLGWHLFLFTTPIQRDRLLYDGTDMRFLPGPSSVWRYRLWAGGSINLYRTFAPPQIIGRAQHQLERPVDLRIVGSDQTPEKLFVTVSKQFFELQSQLQQHQYSVPGVLRQIGNGPIYSNTGALVGGAYLEEKYTLCFLRKPPNLSEKGAATRVIPPPRQPKFSHTLIPDRHLLFCWSALSYNAHAIHLDKKFAQEEYGAKDLVVHGPLTLLLVLEWFHREITRYALERQLSRFHLQSIDYKCLAPLFVDEAMTLCTKPSKFPTPGTLAESWEVWVQKDVGDGVQSVAFKGTIKLRTEYEPRTRNEYKTSESSAEDTIVTSKGAEFKSPLY